MFYGVFSGGVTFSPETDIKDLSGKVVFISGGTKGIGLETALALAKHNASHIYITGRSQKTADLAITTIQTEVPAAKITYLQCDHSDLANVKSCAREFISREKRLDLLFLNAGIMLAPPAKTKQGYEIHFGTNHVAHFLLTKLLLPTMEQTSEISGTDVRIISVASIAHLSAPCSGIVFSELRTEMSGWLATRLYGQSKLANILFTKELARQLKEKNSKVMAVAIHPGVVDTQLYENAEKWFILSLILNIARKMMIFFLSAKEGSFTQLWAATSDRALEKEAATAKVNKGKVLHGEYYTPVGLAGQGGRATQNKELARKLWEWTEEEVKEFAN